jgi:SAM-dependent methyltransferase
MAHYQQLKFFETTARFFPEYFAHRTVLEIGSWDANGSIRRFFKDCTYLGADVAPGPGVDIVTPGECIDRPDESFDVTVSSECFEHNPQWVATFKNMTRMLKPGGLCVVTCASIGRGEHGTSRKHRDASLTALESHADYYANLSKRDFRREFDLPGIFAEHRMYYNKYFQDFYFIGIKKGPGPVTEIPALFSTAVNAITEAASGGFGRRLNVGLSFWLTYGLASALGEKHYHDFKFKARRLLRTLGSSR